MARTKKTAVAEIAEQTPVEVLTTYKGFNKDLTCRDFKFEIGETYTISGKVEACRELPEDMSIGELRDELEIASTQGEL